MSPGQGSKGDMRALACRFAQVRKATWQTYNLGDRDAMPFAPVQRHSLTQQWGEKLEGLHPGGEWNVTAGDPYGDSGRPGIVC
jgi:hypothetical protein